MQDENAAHAKAREVWAFTAIERMYSAIKTAAHLNTSGFSIFGHSAGAQFVHRHLAFIGAGGNALRVIRAVAANAGFYTEPTFEIPFPFGFGGTESVLSEEDLRNYLQVIGTDLQFHRPRCLLVPARSAAACCCPAPSPTLCCRCRAT